MRDYDRALQHDLRLAATYLNRGTLHYRERRYLEAASDLEQALQEGADPCIVYYNWAS